MLEVRSITSIYQDIEFNCSNNQLSTCKNSSLIKKENCVRAMNTKFNEAQYSIIELVVDLKKFIFFRIINFKGEKIILLHDITNLE